MLAYAVILLAIIYLVLHYTGLFEEIARMFGGGSRSAGSTGNEKQRLQVFEDFFGQSGEDEPED